MPIEHEATSRSVRSFAAERRFRERVGELGGTVVEPDWLGHRKPHRVLCKTGHECFSSPTNLLSGKGFCRTCAAQSVDYHRNRSSSAWRRFREQVAALGGVVIEPEWLGFHEPHRVICAAEHQYLASPRDAQRDRGYCRTCGRTKPVARAARSLEAERRFRERVAELGGEVVELGWLGVMSPHQVTCVSGHAGFPRPDTVLRGYGICATCAGRDSAASWCRFRERVAELGGVVLEQEWLGRDTPHSVLCAVGHKCSPHPGSVLSGQGLCSVCAGRDDGRRFRERVAELGGTVIEPGWLGALTPHRVVCAAGHECSPWPSSVLRGGGICRICARRDSADAWRRFRVRVEELRGTVVEPEWLGRGEPHSVVCAAGHNCSPRPQDVQRGQGLCRACSFSSCDALYVVENETHGTVKLGITTGAGGARIGDHRRDGFETVLRFLPGLDDAALLERHTLKTLRAAGIKPARGLEYFERSALAVIFDIVDNWVVPDPFP